MTVEELLKACSSGKMPRVRTSNPVKHSLSSEGQVVAIKQQQFGFSGCTVEYPGLNNHINYHQSNDLGDKFTMRELSLLTE